MGNLPKSAKIYLALVWIMGVAVAYFARLSSLPLSGGRVAEVFLFMGLGALAGSRKVKLRRNKNEDDVGSMSLGFAITFAAMLRSGPTAAVLVGMSSCLSGCLYPRRQAAYQLAFNVSLSAIESWIAGMVYQHLNRGALEISPIASAPAIAAASLVYFLINTGGVAIVIALCTGENPYALWRNTFLWTAPSYFAGASVAAIVLLFFGNHLATALLFGSPVVYLTYQSYAVYVARAEEKQEHIEQLQVSQAQLADLYLATIKSLALAIDAKDQYTHQHILRVQRYAVATANEMGLSGADMEGLNTGALLHDIGKLGVPEYVLLKPGRLTDEEFAKIKQHPEIGAAILDPVEFPWPVLPVVKYHHEKWDGTGYPEGLKGEEIPLTARILAAADVYDALTSTRSYRNAWTHEKAIGVIRKDSGTHFDPRVVEAFLRVIDGVVEEMAREGYGPLVAQSPVSQPHSSKADQAAHAIQRASSELWALYEVAQSLSSSMGLQETLDILARKLSAILPGTGCVFLLREAEPGSLAARAAVGLNSTFFTGSRTLRRESLSNRVAAERRTYLGEYDADDLMLTSSATEQWVPILSTLIVPIIHQGENLGTINIYHAQTHAFSSHDRQLLETIAERAALAIYNGLLFDRTRSHALTDPLTDLYNVRFLTEHVERKCRIIDDLSPENRAPFALLCLDLDSFKPINDNFGHHKGDQVLKDLAHIFRSLVREPDIVCRYGGDEFVMVLDRASASEAEAIAARVQESVANYDPGLHHTRLGSLHLGVSIGIACFPRDGDDCAALLSAADINMYADKTERKLVALADHQPAALREPDTRTQLPRAA